MSGKTIIQILMVFLIVLISLTFYLKYFNKNFKKIEVNKTIEKIDIKENTSSTYIDNINYISSDTKASTCIFLFLFVRPPL